MATLLIQAVMAAWIVGNSSPPRTLRIPVRYRDETYVFRYVPTEKHADETIGDYVRFVARNLACADVDQPRNIGWITMFKSRYGFPIDEATRMQSLRWFQSFEIVAAPIVEGRPQWTTQDILYASRLN